MSKLSESELEVSILEKTDEKQQSAKVDRKSIRTVSEFLEILEPRKRIKSVLGDKIKDPELLNDSVKRKKIINEIINL